MLADPFDDLDQLGRPWCNVADALRWAVRSAPGLRARDYSHVSLGQSAQRSLSRRDHQRARILGTLAALDEREQRAVVAHAEGYTARQIAGALGMGSPVTARKLVAKAQAKLQPRLLELGIVERPILDEERSSG